jgi:Down syndrome cell adhesion molecule
MNRYAIGQFVDISGDVISHLNITHSRSEDGGLYKCVAANLIGSVVHTTRLNVYGPPFIRAISPLKSIAGEDIVIYCPFSGHPIDQVLWERNGVELVSSEWRISLKLMAPPITTLISRL